MPEAVIESQFVEIEADSLKDARRQARAQIPQGLAMISEKILSDGRTLAKEGVAQTEEAAFKLARQGVPPGAKIVEEQVAKEGGHKTFTVQGFTDEEAMDCAKRAISPTARLENIGMKNPGKKGFWGIGKTPHQYEARFFQPAVVKVVYKFPVKIRVEYGDPWDRIYRDGEMVDCAGCAKSVRVQFYGSAKISVVDPRAIQSIALRCQQCGKVVCYRCSTGPSGEGIPVCPFCKSQGGPYFFTR